MNYFLGVMIFSNLAYIGLAVLRANMRVTQDYLRSPRDKHFDEVIKRVVENNRAFSNNESWTFDENGKPQHHQVLEFKRGL